GGGGDGGPPRIADVDRGHSRLLTYVNARVTGGTHQQLVELRARHLEGALVRLVEVLIESEGVAEAAVGGDELRAVLRHVVARLELVDDAEPGEEIVV